MYYDTFLTSNTNSPFLDYVKKYPDIYDTVHYDKFCSPSILIIVLDFLASVGTSSRMITKSYKVYIFYAYLRI